MSIKSRALASAARLREAGAPFASANPFTDVNLTGAAGTNGTNGGSPGAPGHEWRRRRLHSGEQYRQWIGHDQHRRGDRRRRRLRRKRSG